MADSTPKQSWQELVQTGFALAARDGEIPSELITPAGKYTLAKGEAYTEARGRETKAWLDGRVEALHKLHPAEMFEVHMAGQRVGTELLVAELQKVLDMPADSHEQDVLARVQLLANAAKAP